MSATIKTSAAPETATAGLPPYLPPWWSEYDVGSYEPERELHDQKSEADSTNTNIGGCDIRKQDIHEDVGHPVIYKKIGVDASGTVVSNGSRGPSKTVPAKAIVDRTRAAFKRVKDPEIFQKYLDERTKKVRDVSNLVKGKATLKRELYAIATSGLDAQTRTDRVVERIFVEIWDREMQDQQVESGMVGNPNPLHASYPPLPRLPDSPSDMSGEAYKSYVRSLEQHVENVKRWREKREEQKKLDEMQGKCNPPSDDELDCPPNATREDMRNHVWSLLEKLEMMEDREQKIKEQRKNYMKLLICKIIRFMEMCEPYNNLSEPAVGQPSARV